MGAFTGRRIHRAKERRKILKYSKNSNQITTGIRIKDNGGDARSGPQSIIAVEALFVLFFQAVTERRGGDFN